MYITLWQLALLLILAVYFGRLSVNFPKYDEDAERTEDIKEFEKRIKRYV